MLTFYFINLLFCIEEKLEKYSEKYLAIGKQRRIHRGKDFVVWKQRRIDRGKGFVLIFTKTGNAHIQD